MNTITIELCAEDRARLDKLFNALTNLSEDIRANKPCCESCIKTVLAATGNAPTKDAPGKEEPATDAPSPEAPAPEAPAPEAPVKDEPKEEAPTITRADVQQKVVSLAATNKKAKVREIVNRYANRVSEIPESKLAEVYGRLTDLED